MDGRKAKGETRPLHFLMEKPMTTDIKHAIELYKLVLLQKNVEGESKFWLNHSANFHVQAKIA
jgi:hypothetical protein